MGGESVHSGRIRRESDKSEWESRGYEVFEKVSHLMLLIVAHACNSPKLPREMLCSLYAQEKSEGNIAESIAGDYRVFW